MKRFLGVCLALGALFASLPLSAEARLLRNPTVGEGKLAFVYANDIWVTSDNGGEARRLTTFPGAETSPHLSPDGSMVAFSGEYDGNVDVFVVPVEGGEPRRLTWHPGGDNVRGWSLDGKSVLFNSTRHNEPRAHPQLFTVSLNGGMPSRLPLPRVEDGHFSPDGKRMAYQQVTPWDGEWRNYRGGQAQPIRVIDLKSLEVQKLPWEGSDDRLPVWLGDDVFFLSDRDWAMNVWSWNARSGELTQRTFFKDFDCKSLEGGDGKLVFENGGWLYSMAAAGGEPRRLSIALRGDFPWARPHWVEAADQVTDFGLSPTGKRAVFEARGEIFTVPADKGEVRNLTRSPGAADRAPAWSPDGQHIAWFSDEGGEYGLMIADQFGRERRRIDLEDPTFFYTPAWSPDSKHIAFGDADRNLWVVEIESGKAKRVDREGFAHPQRVIYPEWSPDSKWIAYTKRLQNQFTAISVYSVETGKTHLISDGLSLAQSPAWDKGGKLLYFLASTDYGLNVGWLDLSSVKVPYHSSVYVAVLPADEPSPLAPRSDDEEVKGGSDRSEEGKDNGKKKANGKGKDKKGEDAAEEKGEGGGDAPEVRIDFDRLSQRILALNMPTREYAGIRAGAPGSLFIAESIPDQPGLTLHHYSLEEREAKPAAQGIFAFALSHDGSKLMTAMPGDNYRVAPAGPATPGGGGGGGEGMLDLGGLRMEVDPAAEWRQIFREAWRYQRDYFYVDNVHGLDLDWAFEAYSEWLPHVRHRADLNYLLDILGGETAVGHSFNGGATSPRSIRSRSGCSERISRWIGGVTACPASTTARTGTLNCGRR